jgi:uncharacterized membrane-anchored protein
MTRERMISLIAIVLPILVIAAWMGQYALRVKQGNEVTLAIAGFDPRDLLSGHYLQFRVDYGLEIDCTNTGPRCICLESAGDRYVAKRENNCSGESEACAHRLRGQCENNRFVAGIERFYFPEQYQKALAVVPPAATITVSLSKDGTGVITAMDVAGKPLMDWLKNQVKAKN